MNNRIIKFRVWDTKNKEWLESVPYLEYLLDNKDAEVSHHNIDEEMGLFFYPKNPLGPTFKNRIIYQQFTGLKDKNGKEIYEGDILDYSITLPRTLEIFWNNHDPTTQDRQGPDVGRQYRSVIFYHTEEQKKEAIKSKSDIQKKFGKIVVVTEIVKSSKFYKAEEYHQQYYKKKGIKPTCHF